MAQSISKKKSYVGENIRKIRQLKKISQADFAKIFDLARPSVGAYEEGRSEPKIDTLIRIAAYFKISIDVLLTHKMTTNEIFNLNKVNEKLDRVHKKEQTDTTRKFNSYYPPISYVAAKRSIDYIINIDSNKYINDLPTVNLPTASKKKLRAFEIHGGEMEYHQQGLHHGDLLVGETLVFSDVQHHAKEIIVVITDENIFIRRLKEFSPKNIVLSSDDPNYEDLVIDVKKIKEYWLIIASYSTYLNAPTLLEERVLKLENEISSLKKNSG